MSWWYHQIFVCTGRPKRWQPLEQHGPEWRDDSSVLQWRHALTETSGYTDEPLSVGSWRWTGSSWQWLGWTRTLCS